MTKTLGAPVGTVTWGTLCQTGAMVDEQQPAKRVVKRVVKKTAVRPTAPAPTVRYGRPVNTETTAPAARTTTKVATRPAAKAAPATPGPTAKTAPTTKTRRQRPPLELRAKAGTAGRRAGNAWRSVADGARSTSRRVGTATASRAHTVAAWRLPHLNPYLAAVITGAVVSVVSLLLGLGALTIFQAVRGVASGGGLWGSIAFLGIAALVGWLGAALLAGFGTSSPRLTSLLAVIVTIVAILGLFPEASQGLLALAIVPALAIASYVLARWLIDVAENTPDEID